MDTEMEEEYRMTPEQAKQAEERRARSIALLKAEGIPFIEHLPLIEPEGMARIRSEREIADRAVCVILTVRHACDLLNCPEHAAESRDFFLGTLKRWGLEGKLSETERELFHGQGGENAAALMTWKFEAYWVLAWALGLVEEAMAVPREECDCARAVGFVDARGSYEDFLASVHKRSDSEILDAADLIYRIRWATDEARIHGEPAPAGINTDVAMERHIALNWLTGYGDDWDNIPLDT